MESESTATSLAGRICDEVEPLARLLAQAMNGSGLAQGTQARVEGVEGGPLIGRDKVVVRLEIQTDAKSAPATIRRLVEALCLDQTAEQWKGVSEAAPDSAPTPAGPLSQVQGHGYGPDLTWQGNQVALEHYWHGNSVDHVAHRHGLSRGVVEGDFMLWGRIFLVATGRATAP